MSAAVTNSTDTIRLPSGRAVSLSSPIVQEAIEKTAKTFKITRENLLSGVRSGERTFRTTAFETEILLIGIRRDFFPKYTTH